MTSDAARMGDPHERELQYYRRECNDLGARLLRLQEEQSQAFREARRSRTVVKLVREAYRLGDPAQTAHDVGGPVLEVIVDNALCDRAALLREEPLGSGRFLVAHAIGLPDAAADAVTIRNPPVFFFSTAHTLPAQVPAGILDVLQLHYVLWAYDQSSGYALVIGNRSEGNVSRPFEAGDQELIESALSVYLDVLYRKHAEVQLRQAKQAAEEASQAQARFLETLSHEVRAPLQDLTALAKVMASGLVPADKVAWFQDGASRIVDCATRLAALTDNAMRLADPEQQSPLLDVEWVGLNDVIRASLRLAYASSVRHRVELNAHLPRRRLSVCVDRERMQRAMRILINGALARAERGSQVRIAAGRRSDGAVEIVVSTPAEAVAVHPAMLERSGVAEHDGATPGTAGPGDEKLENARRIVGAHGGILVTEARPGGGTQTRVILPARNTREDDPASVNVG